MRFAFARTVGLEEKISLDQASRSDGEVAKRVTRSEVAEALMSGFGDEVRVASVLVSRLSSAEVSGGELA